MSKSDDEDISKYKNSKVDVYTMALIEWQFFPEGLLNKKSKKPVHEMLTFVKWMFFKTLGTVKNWYTKWSSLKYWVFSFYSEFP